MDLNKVNPEELMFKEAGPGDALPVKGFGFVNTVAPINPEDLVLSGEDAVSFLEMLEHNRVCIGIDAVPPCGTCARRQESVFRILELKNPPKGKFKCPHCESRRSTRNKVEFHIRMVHG